jgi:hypothetical protein
MTSPCPGLRRLKGLPPDLRLLFQKLEAAGWHVSQTGSTHLRLQPPRVRPVCVHGPPSDHRSVHNLKALVRRTAQGPAE